MSKSFWVRASLFFAIALWGCVESSKELTTAEREELRPYLSTTAPTPSHPLDVQLENKVRLLGYDVSPAEAKPGQPVTVTYYWKCERPLGKGWRLFTHLADAAGTNRLNQDREGVVRRLYQPERWKVGEYIKDEQRITLPADWNSPRATIYLGIFKDNTRLDVTKGPTDGERRIRVVTLQTGVSERSPATPSLRAHRVTAPIAIDGVLDESAWNDAPKTPRFVNTMNGEEAQPETYVRTLYDDQNMYFAFEVKDTFLKSSFENNDDHLWEQDCVEIMIDPDNNGRNYYEIQVAPTGKVFDTRYDSRRQPQPFGHVDWNSNIRAAVKTDGTPNDDDDDRGYVVEIALPWSGLNFEGVTRSAPEANARWRMNFYVMDSPEEGQQQAAGWAAVRVPDFHTPNRFGRVQFFDPSAPAAPAVETAAPDGTGEAPTTGSGDEQGAARPIKIPPGSLRGINTKLSQTRDEILERGRVDRRQPGEPAPERPAPTTPRQ